MKDYPSGMCKAHATRTQSPTPGLPGVGAVSPQIPIKACTISRQAERWFISFRFEVEDVQEGLSETWFFPTVGVDLGVKNLATLSTGKVIEGAKSYRRFKDKLQRLQWLNRRKVVGSANWKKSQLQIAKLHRKIANIRKDTLHKVTTYLAKNHSEVTIEDLNVSGIMANHKLAASVQDMGFYEFRRQLTYKCKLNGTKLIIADRWYPSSKTCSHCGTVKKSLTLDERVFHCEACNFTCDRDLNAAINLKWYAFNTAS